MEGQVSAGGGGTERPAQNGRRYWVTRESEDWGTF